MWRKAIGHNGLKASRVIIGETEGETELVAQLQMAAWEQRWQRIQQTEVKRRAAQELARVTDQKKHLAIQRTREAEEQMAALAKILRDGIELDHALEWEALKDRSSFPKPCPEPRPPEIIPRRPSQNDAIFRPVLELLDWIIPSRRARKIALADQKFRFEDDRWTALKNQIALSNQKNQLAYPEKLRKWQQQKNEFDANQAQQHAALETYRSAYEAGESRGVTQYFDYVLLKSDYPDGFPKSFSLDYIASSKMLILEYHLPDVSSLPTLKELKYIATRDQFQEVRVSDAWLNRTYDDVLYQITLRTMYELFQSDTVDALGTVVFNGWVNSIDKSTGQEVNACVLSVQATKAEFTQINLANVEPKACFRKLKGVSASKLISLSPVRPILQLSKDDKRFVPSYEVAAELNDSVNLAAMDWLDFENLIREIFEKEFSQNGGEVKITQASRDGGVDAIAFDPDPIRGGKIVIQAKRYTNPVGVSAVRDLFGTVHNEGATKGILVTTSDYGPDAYEFAKGKPLTLLSGSELLYLLQKHGHRAKINLAEAKRLLMEQDQTTRKPHS